MSFTHTSGTNSIGSGSNVHVSLPTAPSPGDLIVVGLGWNGTGLSGLSVKDSAGNSYTTTIGVGTNTGCSCIIAYLNNAPSNVTGTITATWTTSVSDAVINVDDFAVSSGTSAFGAATTNNMTGSTGTLVGGNRAATSNTSLYYAIAMNSAGQNWAAPIGGGFFGNWTGNAGTAPAQAEYNISTAITTLTASYSLTGTCSHNISQIVYFNFTATSAPVTSHLLSCIGAGT